MRDGDWRVEASQQSASSCEMVTRVTVFFLDN